MSTQAEQLEAALRDGYREEAGYYVQALHLAEQVAAALQAGADANDSLQQVLAFFDQVAAVEKRLAATREQWRQLGRQAGPELSREMDRVAGLIQQITGHITTAEATAASRRDQLAPQIDVGIRARRMQQAYGRGF